MTPFADMRMLSSSLQLDAQTIAYLVSARDQPTIYLANLWAIPHALEPVCFSNCVCKLVRTHICRVGKKINRICFVLEMFKKN